MRLHVLDRVSDANINIICSLLSSDVPARAWPESQGSGLALDGLGLTESQARPWCKAQAWLGPGLGHGRGLSATTGTCVYYTCFVLCTICIMIHILLYVCCQGDGGCQPSSWAPDMVGVVPHARIGCIPGSGLGWQTGLRGGGLDA